MYSVIIVVCGVIIINMINVLHLVLTCSQLCKCMFNFIITNIQFNCF